MADFFAPADWFELNRRYHVLAYNNPLAIDLPDGGPGSALLFALDKNGKAYLLDRANLGGVGHPLLAQQVGDLGLLANTSRRRLEKGPRHDGRVRGPSPRLFPGSSGAA